MQRERKDPRVPAANRFVYLHPGRYTDMFRVKLHHSVPSYIAGQEEICVSAKSRSEARLIGDIIAHARSLLGGDYSVMEVVEGECEGAWTLTSALRYAGSSLLSFIPRGLREPLNWERIERYADPFARLERIRALREDVERVGGPAVFFDLTGTLTLPESEMESLNAMYRALGRAFSCDPETLQHAVESYRQPIVERRHIEYRPMRDLIAEGVERFLRRRLGEEERELIRREYIRAHVENLRLRERAREALEEACEFATHVGVISDADRDYLKEVLRALEVTDYLDSWTSAEEAGVGKPTPWIFSVAWSKACFISPAGYIGDSETRDYRGARKYGWNAYLVRSDMDLLRAVEIIRAGGADRI